MTSSTEQTETIVNPTPMDTSAEVPTSKSEEKPEVNVAEEESSTTENKSGKRKRPTKKPVETDEANTSISTGRPRRTLTKREDLSTSLTNGAQTKSSKSKTNAQQEEQDAEAGDDADDEQEREKNIPVQHDVGDLVWVKMGGHPWWPSIIIRDPNDANKNFTKVSGNARAKRLFFVSFYGSTADFAWVSDSAMIAYKGVEAFTLYAQSVVDQATTKSQKENLTERFQLKVTISRREDWESAVREADAAMKQSNETRLREVDPKLGFYANKPGKGQQGRRSTKTPKTEETSNQNELSSLNAADRSLLAEKTFEFKSEDENENDESLDLTLRKSTSGKAHIPRVAMNGRESTPPPPTSNKRRNARQSEEASKTKVFGQNANGSSVSYQQRSSETPETPTKNDTEKLNNGGTSGRKRGRPTGKQTNASSSEGEGPAPEFNSATPSVTMKFTTQRKSINKPQAFSNSSNNNDTDGKHDIRTGFLSASEEQEVLDALEQLRATKTFEEAEQVAKRRFEHILCLNLNRTHVDVPQEWFYTFLFTHPSLIMKNPQWFNDKIDDNPLEETDSKSDGRNSNSLLVLKNQLAVLSKLYRNELDSRSVSPTKKRQSTVGKSGKRKGAEAQSSADEMANDSHGEELIN